ncbi:MAG: hypothetical protein IPP68_04450 [Elusimicrobia bacterium]|nr:hypothetical protein [Elusimicrobiota bacterium]
MENTKPVEVEERKGWTIGCPSCSKSILYTKLVNWESPTPFFYCDSCNDVLLRKSDKKLVESRLAIKNIDVPGLEKLWEEIASNAPNCGKGGRFTVWSNVRCPHCKKELPYNSGIKNSAVRINEMEIILVDGATVIGDSSEDTWRVKVLS